MIVNAGARGCNIAARAGRAGRGARGAGAQVARGGPRGRPRGSRGAARGGQAIAHTGIYF